MRGKARAIAVNTSFRLAPWADILYACDQPWWLHYFPEVARAFKGEEMWTISRPVAQQFRIDYVFGNVGQGLSKSDKQINTGLNSGYQAIGLAHMWGCKRILLLGFDFQRTKGRVHWHPDHPNKLGNGGRFASWVKEMSHLADDAKRAGLDIVNCSRDTALRCFRRSTIEVEL